MTIKESFRKSFLRRGDKADCLKFPVEAVIMKITILHDPDAVIGQRGGSNKNVLKMANVMQAVMIRYREGCPGKGQSLENGSGVNDVCA